MVMAQVYTLAGEFDKALDELEKIMFIEAWCTPAYLKADPIFEPIVNLPRMKKMFARYDAKYGAS